MEQAFKVEWGQLFLLLMPPSLIMPSSKGFPTMSMGHFGYIELPIPIYHPSHVNELKQIFSLVCLKCLRMKKGKGYAGGDEAKMLKRHLQDTSAIIGIGADRAAAAASLLNKHGYTDACHTLCMGDRKLPRKFGPHSDNGKVGVVILDDGMQHWSLLRNVEIVMLNSMMPWGNSHLIPRGPLREPLSALGRADPRRHGSSPRKRARPGREFSSAIMEKERVTKQKNMEDASR